MRLFDSFQLIQKFLYNKTKASLFLFVFFLDYDYFFLLDFNIDLLLNLDQLRECNPIIDVFQVFFDDYYQIFKVRLSSHIGSEYTQQFHQSFLQFCCNSKILFYMNIQININCNS